MSLPVVCEYARFNDGDGVEGECTGPVPMHDCSYYRELADADEPVKQCNCCKSCARECYLNV